MILQLHNSLHFPFSKMDFFSGSEEVDFMSHLVTTDVGTFQDSSVFWTSFDTSDNMSNFSQQNTCTDDIFPASFSQRYLSVSCSSVSQNDISVIPLIPPAEYNSTLSNNRKRSCNKADVC